MPLRLNLVPFGALVRGGLLIAVFIAFFISRVDILALDPAKPLKNFNLQVWTYQNGLPVNSINAIAQSRDGYIWLGTSKGLVRFDGSHFDILGPGPWRNLRSINVSSLCPAPEGGIWYAVERSYFAYYDTVTGWRAGQPETANTWSIKCLTKDSQGTLWAGGDFLKKRSALYGVPGITVASNIPGILSIHGDHRGRTWIGTSRSGLFYMEDGKAHHVEDPALTNKFIFAIASDARGNVFLGTHVGLVCLNSNLQFQIPDLPRYEIKALFVDRHSAVWLGTTDGGILRWFIGRFDQIQKKDGLCDDNVLCITEDHEGSLWAGTRNGLVQLTDVKFPLISESQGVTALPVLSVSPAPDGSLWLATAKGIMNYNGWGHQLGTQLTPPQPYTRYTKRVLQSRNGDLYAVNGRNEVLIFSEGRQIARHPTPSMPVALAEDSHSMILSCGGRLFRVNREGLTPFKYQSGTEPQLHWILNLWVGKDDALWVASGNGLARIQNESYRQWTMADGLADNTVRWVTEDDRGTVWLATSLGITRLDEDKITNFYRQDGLPDDNIFAILDDTFGNLWVDSSLGLFRLRKRDLDAFANGESLQIECVRHDGPESVKPMDRFEQEASGCRTPDGRIWFPRASGALMIDPTNVPINHIGPPVQVKSVRANGQPISQFRGARIPPGQGSIEFHFAALSFIAPQQVKCRYRLEGLDSHWSEPTDHHEAVYSNLKPGRYKFRLSACNADGIWSPTEETVELVLLPHFYQTHWFRALLVLGCLGAVGGFLGSRALAQKKKEHAAIQARAHLENQVRERTAELEARQSQLESEIAERLRVQQQLIQLSREAGMAEMATGTLHNVGNLLNSVNVSACLIHDQITQLPTLRLAMLRKLFDQHKHDIASFLADDPKGKLVPEFISLLASQQEMQQADLLIEASSLMEKIDHIKVIVSMQQSYASLSGLTEDIPVPELVEDALRLVAGSLHRYDITVLREFVRVPPARVDKHKVLQILVNLLQNATYALEASGRDQKLLTLRIYQADDHKVCVAVRDNGIGIPPENLTTIFNHGFTTKKDGHGFGLHTGALAATEMGGSLHAHSDGPDQGATFTLSLPIASSAKPPPPSQS